MVITVRAKGFYVNGKFFFPIGVNYWPRDIAVRLWKEYNPKAIEHEFQIMEDIGINNIRFFIMWDDILEKPEVMDQQFFPKFDHFHETARKHKITLTPTLFIGHMSGQNWFPDWF